MPIYEYQCSSCGHTFEIMQKISADPIKICPQCHKASVSKLISAPNFQLKGEGWYVTDFRDKNQKADKAKADKPKTDKTDDSTVSEKGSDKSTSKSDKKMSKKESKKDEST